MQDFPDFAFPTPGVEARCSVQIFDGGERTVAVATELPARDVRLVDVIEHLATELCRQGHANPARLLLVQHEPGRAAEPREVSAVGAVRPPRFELVALAREGDAFARPIWAPLSRAQLEEMIGRDFPAP
jgi:hypothetical protein